MGSIADLVDALVEEANFSGVVRVDRGDQCEFEQAYGLADRRHGIAMAADSQVTIASGSKGFTAVAVMSLVHEGVLSLTTTARSVLGDDLPLIGDKVTVEHLLSHRSGIGDYLDEDSDMSVSDYVLGRPVHELATTEAFLPLLDGYPTKFAAGEQFAYCNGGYVVLALIAERVSGVGYHQLVRDRVCTPADMSDTDFLRSDDLPARAALSYLEIDGEWRTNVFHLPVRATGDGGAYTTAADVHRFWTALFDGRLLPSDLVAEMVRPRSEVPAEEARYGMGFWLHESSDTVFLEGYDAGASFRSRHDPHTHLTQTVMANTSEGAWPITVALERALDTRPGEPIRIA